MDSMESFEAVIAADAAAQAVSGVNETIQLQQAAPIVAELAANPAVVAALAVQGFEIDAAAVQNVALATPQVERPSGVGKVEQTVESVLTEIANEVVAEVEAAAVFVETEAKEGYVAAENLVRKVLNHHISAGGGSIIRNPA